MSSSLVEAMLEPKHALVLLDLEPRLPLSLQKWTILGYVRATLALVELGKAQC